MSGNGVRWFGACVIFAALSLTGCSDAGFSTGGPNAYDGLTDEQREWVVPETEPWAAGRYCVGNCLPGGGDTSIQTGLWAPISRIESVDVVGNGRTLVSAVIADRPRRIDPSKRIVELNVRGNEDQTIAEALESGLEVWVATDGLRRPILVFDEVGRVGAIGVGAAQYGAEPLIKNSEAAGADSPYDHFLSLATGPAPQEFLTADNPGLPSEVVTGRKLRYQLDCVSHGNDGPTLVFPTGTVAKQPGRGGSNEVFNQWSGLETLPFRYGANRIEMTIQRTTAEALGVVPFAHCNTEVFFVEAIRIIDTDN